MSSLQTTTHQIIEELKALPTSSLDLIHSDKDEEYLNIIEIHSKKLDAKNQERLKNEFFQYGPLHTLLNKKEITEIIINGMNSIWFEMDGKLQKLDDAFMSTVSFNNFINRICQECQIDPSIETPFATAFWKGFRMHLVRGSVHQSSGISEHTQMTFRRIANKDHSLKELKQNSWTNDCNMKIITDIFHQKKNILVIGETGSGKTTVLSCLLKLCQPNERILLLEDASEISPPNSVSSKLLTRKNSSLPVISLNDLLFESLRMRPDRIVLGELRGSEAKDYLLALSTGHVGSLATLHARSAREALIRLEFLVQLGAESWGVANIRRLLSLSLDYIIAVKRTNTGRRLASIDQVCSYEGDQVLLESVFQDPVI